MRMRLTRWLGFVFALSTILAVTGCTGILGDYPSGGISDEGGVDSSLPTQDGAGSADGTATTDAGNDTRSTGPEAASGDDTGVDSSIVCPANQKPCNGSCITKTDTATGCGDPNSCAPCDFPNAVPACVGGACALDHRLNG